MMMKINFYEEKKFILLNKLAQQSYHDDKEKCGSQRYFFEQNYRDPEGHGGRFQESRWASN